MIIMPKYTHCNSLTWWTLLSMIPSIFSETMLVQFKTICSSLEYLHFMMLHSATFHFVLLLLYSTLRSQWSPDPQYTCSLSPCRRSSSSGCKYNSLNDKRESPCCTRVSVGLFTVCLNKYWNLNTGQKANFKTDMPCSVSLCPAVDVLFVTISPSTFFLDLSVTL